MVTAGIFLVEKPLGPSPQQKATVLEFLKSPKKRERQTLKEESKEEVSGTGLCKSGRCLELPPAFRRRDLLWRLGFGAYDT